MGKYHLNSALIIFSNKIYSPTLAEMLLSTDLHIQWNAFSELFEVGRHGKVLAKKTIKSYIILERQVPF